MRAAIAEENGARIEAKGDLPNERARLVARRGPGDSLAGDARL